MNDPIIRSIISILLLSSSLFSQSVSWQWQDPVPSLRAQGEADFINALKGWRVGIGGEVQYTEDGGINWERRAVDTDLSLIGLDFLDAQTGFVVGDQGIIYKTTDGGNSWQEKAALPGVGFITNVYFRTPNIGIAVATFGNILKTVDGGETWDIIYVGLDENLYDIYHFSGNTWLACGTDGSIFRSVDDGITWTSFQHPTIATFFDIEFVDPLTGWVSGAGGILARTIDGGINWSVEFVPQTSFINDIHFEDALNGWATTGDNRILKTTDGGSGWAFVDIDTSLNLSQGFNQIIFTDNETVFLLGDVIYKSTNNGIEWQRIDRMLPFTNYKDVFFVSPDSGWVIGLANSNATRLAYTSNGGQTWEFIQLLNSSTNSNGLFFINSQKGWVGANASILRTTDRGISWEVHSLPVTETVNKIFFIDSLHGWLTTTDGSALRSTDGGVTWVVQSIGTQFLQRIYFFNDQHGWAVGRNGAIYNTTDSGQSWSSQNSTTGSTLYDIHFITFKTGWCVGSYGKILKTTDGGNNWVSQDFGNTASFRKIRAIDENTVWVMDIVNNASVGPSLTIDGGLTWTSFTAPPFLGRESMFLPDSETIIIVGGESNFRGIVKGTLDLTTGLEPYSTETTQAENFSLYPNYPNPFNPETTISYSLRTAGFVELVIYNALGQPLETLLQENQPAGAYNKVFHAKHYPSGTYYYRLTVNGKQQTKGMLLVK